VCQTSQYHVLFEWRVFLNACNYRTSMRPERLDGAQMRSNSSLCCVWGTKTICWEVLLLKWEDLCPGILLTPYGYFLNKHSPYIYFEAHKPCVCDTVHNNQLACLYYISPLIILFVLPVFEEYQKISGRSIEDSIKREMSGCLEDVFLAIGLSPHWHVPLIWFLMAIIINSALIDKLMLIEI